MNGHTVAEGPVGTERWNLGALMVDVTCFAIGMAFLDQNAVLPLLLQRLGASGRVIGAAAALRVLAFSGLQIAVAYRMHGKPRQKPFLARVAMLTRLPLLLLPVLLWHAGDSGSSRQVALAAVIALLTIWTMGDGLGYVPWMEIVARSFTDRTRGRFFAGTQLASGLITVVIAAFVVRGILNSYALPYPHNYAILAALAALMFQASMAGVLMIREPPAPKVGPRVAASMREYLIRLPTMIRGNPVFGRLALVQLLLGFGAAASPFYVLYASHRFHLPDAWGGTYQGMQAVGVVALTPFWTFLSERKSPATAVRALAIACLLTPLAAITIGLLSPWLFGLVFVLMGGSLGWGMWIVLNHYMLTQIDAEERPVFVALINFLFLPSALYPCFGGMLVHGDRLMLVAGIPVLFMVCGLVISIGAVLSLSLPHALPSH